MACSRSRPIAWPAGPPVDWGLFLIAVIGLVLAHAANNMINDYFDTTSGVDTDDYVRALYAPHPILSGWVTKRQLGIAILLVNAVGAAIMLYLATVRGPLIIAFALAGLFISVFYVAPPIRLKHHGLGEPGVFLDLGSADGRRDVPGGDRDDRTVGAAGVGAVRAARDERAVRQAHRQDRGRRRARRPDAAGHPRRVPGAGVGRWLMIAFYPLTILSALVGLIGPWVFIVVLGIPRLLAVLQTFRAPEPAAPPPDYPTWPLWFVGWAFVHTRRAGGLLTLGLLLNALVPIALPWL